MIKEGDKVPRFSLPADDGTTVTQESLRGRNTILYFYPKDDTPGCTTEACDFRDAFPRFGKGDADVIGVSPDNVESHRKFKKKFRSKNRLAGDRLESAQHKSTTPRKSTNWRASRRFENGLECLSAILMSGVCTIWFSRCWTIRSMNISLGFVQK